MGLFSSKKVVYVSSVAYNMAGPITDRISVLKSTVSRHILLGEKKVGLGERIVKTQLDGPTMDQRGWFRWARNNYPKGLVSGSLNNEQDVDPDVVEPYVYVPSGHTVTMDEVFVVGADIMHWANKHILETSPALLDTEWVVDLNTETLVARIQYEDLSYDDISVPDYERTAHYIVAYYHTENPADPPAGATARVFIYKVGTGNVVLDALYVPGQEREEFFPVIPLRINNKPISHEDFEDDYKKIAKAYKKCMGQKIDEILEQIEDNENVDDIDYATVVFGVEVVTREKCGLRYLYEFFKGLIGQQAMSPSALAVWYGGTLPDPNSTPAAIDYRKPPKISTIKVSGKESLISHMDIRLNWVTIAESIHIGLGKPDAKSGSLWFETRPGFTINRLTYVDSGGNVRIAARPYKIPHARLFWQIGENTYKVLDIYGMVHENYVYGGKVVNMTLTQALDAANAAEGSDEGYTGDDGEGFIIPLHYPTLTKIPVLHANQLALSNRHIVFNCYQIVKIRWYQRGIFKILISIVLSIITAFVFPGAVGLLGTALQVGTFLGFSGIGAIIVGAAVNALASIVLMTLIEKAAIAIFGEGLGRLLGQIFAFFAFQMVSNWAQGLGFTIDWGYLMRMENLMGLLNSTVKGVSGWIQGEIAGIQEEMELAGEKFKGDMKRLEKKAFDVLGAGGGVIDPLMFTQTQSRFLPGESRDAFLHRTLMTGSDLIDLSMTMIEDFTDINLNLDTETI